VDLDWGLKAKGSFMIPINDVIEAKERRLEGSFIVLHYPFLKLRYREETCLFFFLSKLSGAVLGGVLGGLSGAFVDGAFGAPSLSKSPYEQIANAIEALKKHMSRRHRGNQVARVCIKVVGSRW